MQLTSDPAASNQIRSFEQGAVHLRNEVIRSDVIISAEEVITDWQPSAFDELSINDFARALELNPDIILFGTGLRQRFPNITVLTEIMRKGVAIEVMETNAACRTFNVLVNEHRSVVAALLVD
jgi:uncharacterized protein